MTTELNLKPGSRIRTGGATYEVTQDASVPAALSEVKPQGTRLIKVFCETCGYTVRITSKWLRAGVPQCPNPTCGRMGGCMTVEVKATDSSLMVASATAVLDRLEAAAERLRAEDTRVAPAPGGPLHASEPPAYPGDDDIPWDRDLEELEELIPPAEEPVYTSESTLAQLLAELPE